MATADDYLTKAQALEAIAVQISLETDRAEILAQARALRALAAAAEKLDDQAS